LKPLSAECRRACAIDNGTIIAMFFDVSEAITLGGDVVETLLNAVDVLETGLFIYVDDRKSLSIPSKAKMRQKKLIPYALEYAKLWIYQSCAENPVL
jgi:hypothetical protein